MSTSCIWGSTLGMLGMPWSTHTWPQLRNKAGPFQASSSAPTTTWMTVRAGVSDTASQAGGSAGKDGSHTPPTHLISRPESRRATLEHLLKSCSLIVLCSSLPSQVWLWKPERPLLRRAVRGHDRWRCGVVHLARLVVLHQICGHDGASWRPQASSGNLDRRFRMSVSLKLL